MMIDRADKNLGKYQSNNQGRPTMMMMMMMMMMMKALI